MVSSLSVLLLGSLLLAACNAGQPSLALETDQIKIGQVVNGEIVTRQIAVRNDGESPLVIEAVSTSCGCTQASVDPMQIPPGSSATLQVEFDSGAHGPDLTGTLMRQIFIASNDPNQPEVIVELEADILPRP